MRIRGIGIDGFGRFAGRHFEPLDPGLNVFVGSNEAGKSTLLAFIQAALYGFPRQRRDAHYPAFNGGAHGGRLWLEKHDGLYILQRRATTSGKDLQLTLPGGEETRSEDAVRQLLGGASKEVYTTVFAFSLDELQELRSLEGTEVSAQIYSAGLGAGGVPAAIAALRDQEESIYKKRGRSHAVAAITRELDDVQLQLSARKRDDERYAELIEQQNALTERVGDLASSAARARERQARLQRLLEARPAWARWRELTTVVGATDVSAVPAGAVPRLETLEAAAIAVLNRRGEIEDELASAEAALAALSIDGRVLAAASLIDTVENGRQSYEESRRDLPKRRSELRSLESDLAAAVAEMGPGWNVDAVANLDISATARQRVNDHQQAMDRAERAAEREYAALEALRLQRAELEAEYSTATGARDAMVRPGEAAAELRARLAALSGEAPGPTMYAPLSVVAATGAALGAGGFAVAGIAGAAIGLFATAIASIAGFAAFRKPSGRGSKAIDPERRTITAQLEAHEEYRSLERRVDELGEQRARCQARVEHASEVSRDAAAARERESIAWGEHVGAAGLQAGTSPRGALELMSLARVGNERQRAVAAMSHRIAAIEADIDRHDAEIATAWVAAHGDGVAKVPDTATSTLVEGLRWARENVAAADRLESSLRTTREAHARTLLANAEAAADLHRHLEQCGAAHGDDLRARAAAWAEREELLREVRELEARIVQAAGPGDEFRPFVATLESTGSITLESESATGESEVRQLAGEHDEALTELGGVKRELAALASGEGTSALLAKRESLRGQAAELAREWAKARLARLLIERARARYESERQPAVVRAAQSYFAEMTLGRYQQILSPLGESALRVVDEDGAEKTPDQLSRGTREQLYLALRFGLIEQFTERSGPLPIVVDEVLVNFDGERALAAARGFARLAQRHQVIAFTCHEWVVDLFRAADASARVWRLDPASNHGANRAETGVASGR